MKRTVVVVLLSALVAACATGPIETNPLPKIAEPENAAELVVIREDAFFQSIYSYFILLDDKEIFGIRSGEYTRFQVSPGKHTLGVKCLLLENKIDINLEPKTKAYYFFSKKFLCANVEPMQPQDGEALAGKSSYRSFE